VEVEPAQTDDSLFSPDPDAPDPDSPNAVSPGPGSPGPDSADPDFADPDSAGPDFADPDSPGPAGFPWPGFPWPGFPGPGFLLASASPGEPLAPMFDFAWSEIALIAAVALIAIGPKDMPAAIRAVSGMVKKARRMAAEFQTHVDEMVREADLSEVRNSFNEIRNFDFRGAVEKAVDPDGGLRSTFASNPLDPTPAAAPATNVDELAVSEPVATEPAGADTGGSDATALVTEPAEPETPRAPAFIPPNMVPPPEPVGTVARSTTSRCRCSIT
jgi:sec-independent protein translocase protein TatB